MRNHSTFGFSDGDFVDSSNTPLGRHHGIINYTIGQRKGLGVTFGEPRYVTEINAENNTVTLGRNDELFTNCVTADNVNLISFDALDKPIRIKARTRYNQKESVGTLSLSANGIATVIFDSPVRAVAPGQAVVFYDGEYVVGGGTII